MKLEALVYSPLLEEEQSVVGWSKQTIEYINDNRSKVNQTIRGIAKSISKQPLQTPDVEDIYMEILLYLHKSDDYNLSKAIERSSSGSIVSLEGYINSCIKFCVIRYLTTAYKIDKDVMRENIDSEGKELSIFDTISDENSSSEFEKIFCDLEQQCKACESIRYKYGPDIYMLWYVRILTMSEGLTDVFRDILNMLGVTKKELVGIEKKSANDEVMTNFAKAISNLGIDRSLRILEQYVYSAPRIKEVICGCN